MLVYINQMRQIGAKKTVKHQIIETCIILFLGIILGVFSKYLDHHQATLPLVLSFLDQYLDLHNYFSGFAPWIFLATLISIKSDTPLRASINVFFFLIGMLSGYYIYWYRLIHFIPISYVMIWIIFSFISLFLAYICWYAIGKGKIAILISASIIAVLGNIAFAYGWLYFSIRSFMNLLTYVLGIIILKRENHEMIMMLGLSILIAILFHVILPFQFY